MRKTEGLWRRDAPIFSPIEFEYGRVLGFLSGTRKIEEIKFGFLSGTPFGLVIGF